MHLRCGVCSMGDGSSSLSGSRESARVHAATLKQNGAGFSPRWRGLCRRGLDKKSFRVACTTVREQRLQRDELFSSHPGGGVDAVADAGHAGDGLEVVHHVHGSLPQRPHVDHLAAALQQLRSEECGDQLRRLRTN